MDEKKHTKKNHLACWTIVFVGELSNLNLVEHCIRQPDINQYEGDFILIPFCSAITLDLWSGGERAIEILKHTQKCREERKKKIPRAT